MKIFDKKFSDDYWNMDVHCSRCHDIRLKNVIKKMARKFRRRAARAGCVVKAVE
jgi:hypothetical protein